MQFAQIQKMDDGLIVAKIIRHEGRFCLVAYHMMKDVSREEALKIKNEYKMKSFSMGYEGVIPKSVFVGGKSF